MRKTGAGLLKEAEQYAFYATEKLTHKDQLLAKRIATSSQPGALAAKSLEAYCRVTQELAANYLFPYVGSADRLLLLEMLRFRARTAALKRAIAIGSSTADNSKSTAKIREFQSLCLQLQDRIEQSGLMAELTATQKEVLEHVVVEIMQVPDVAPVKGLFQAAEGH